MTNGTGASSVRQSALIIAGAAGKGPYAAGALSVLAGDARFDIRCVYGASSGALNAAVYAAGLRCNRAPEAAELLCELWRKQANWWRIITHAQRVAIVYNALSRFRGPGQREVHLEVVVASLQGRLDSKYRHLRYEQKYTFESADFENERKLREIAELSVLSSTIPVVFPPRDFKLDGQFWDGGVVNNTPIGNALKANGDIDHLIVITPDAEKVSSERYGRFSLFRLIEMLIDERLARDLTEAKSFNGELAALGRAGIDMSWLKSKLGWRLLQFIELRPDDDLRGNLISGFFVPEQRREYLTLGKRAAEKCLHEWQPREYSALAAPGARSPLPNARRTALDGSN